MFAADSIDSLSLELNPLEANIHLLQHILAGNHTLPLNIWPQMLSETVGQDYDPSTLYPSCLQNFYHMHGTVKFAVRLGCGLAPVGHSCISWCT